MKYTHLDLTPRRITKRFEVESNHGRSLWTSTTPDPGIRIRSSELLGARRTCDDVPGTGTTSRTGRDGATACARLHQTVGVIPTLEQGLNRMQTVGLIPTLEQCLNRMQTMGLIHTLEQCLNRMQTVGLIHTLEQCLNRMQTVGLIHTLEQCLHRMQTVGLIPTLEQCLHRMQTMGLIYTLEQYLKQHKPPSSHVSCIILVQYKQSNFPQESGAPSPSAAVFDVE
ncbi:hypothetical protein AAFF_G00203800 [Aldrovandia affinis]|uniref:Uncharacterized protein n=1 Tax=Aldrovandia affinis TaxID=143900 RepID=A0AAD7WW33_9TELE|nr:hypothetical protein AAFF_G00203800 [Aldrovandia affinis]